MRRATRQTWATRVEAWQKSGMTAREYAAEIGVNPKTLSYWKWRFRREAEEPAAQQPGASDAEQSSPVTFVEVLPSAALSPPQAEPFIVHVAGERRVTVPAHFDPESLRRLLAVLEQAS